MSADPRGEQLFEFETRDELTNFRESIRRIPVYKTNYDRQLQSKYRLESLRSTLASEMTKTKKELTEARRQTQKAQNSVQNKKESHKESERLLSEAKRRTDLAKTEYENAKKAETIAKNKTEHCQTDYVNELASYNDLCSKERTLNATLSSESERKQNGDKILEDINTLIANLKSKLKKPFGTQLDSSPARSVRPK